MNHPSELVSKLGSFGISEFPLDEQFKLCHLIISQGAISAEAMTRNLQGILFWDGKTKQRHVFETDKEQKVFYDQIFQLCKEVVLQGLTPTKQLIDCMENIELNALPIEQRVELCKTISSVGDAALDVLLPKLPSLVSSEGAHDEWLTLFVASLSNDPQYANFHHTKIPLIFFGAVHLSWKRLLLC